MKRQTNTIIQAAFLFSVVSGLAFAGGHGLTIDWHTIDGGGAMQSTGGGFTLDGTIGQADAGVLTGGGFQLTGGFWFEQPPGDCNATGIVNLDDYTDLEACLDGPGGVLSVGCECFDFDSDNDVDLKNYAAFQVGVTGN